MTCWWKTVGDFRITGKAAIRVNLSSLYCTIKLLFSVPWTKITVGRPPTVWVVDFANCCRAGLQMSRATLHETETRKSDHFSNVKFCLAVTYWSSATIGNHSRPSCWARFPRVTCDLDLDSIKMNQPARYLVQRSFISKVIVRRHSDIHRPATVCCIWTTKVMGNEMKSDNRCIRLRLALRPRLTIIRTFVMTYEVSL